MSNGVFWNIEQIRSRMANCAFSWCESTVYRINTYPIVHQGFIHTFLNMLALAPLLERFEAEYGSLVSIALFLGRTCYTIILGRILKRHIEANPVISLFYSSFHASCWYIYCRWKVYSSERYCSTGLEVGIQLLLNLLIPSANKLYSVWVFLLLGSEAIRTFRSNPYFRFVTSLLFLRWRQLSLTFLMKHWKLQNTNLDHALAHKYHCICPDTKHELFRSSMRHRNWICM